ncbi:TDP-N-acetylfucosamine:lipid II N-acetylfucosaminyltransferase [Bacillota bacterium LCP21S3_A4]
MKKGRDIKYLHILLHNETKYNEKLFRMLNNKKIGFDPSEHFFITPHMEVFKKLSVYGDNIQYTTKNGLYIINKLSDQAEWIFIHALNLNKGQIIRIKKKVAAKIIWRTWGHDIWGEPQRNFSIIYVAKKILDGLYVKKIRQFYGVGMGFKYDSIPIEKRFGNLNLFPLNYTFQDGLEETYHKIINTRCIDDGFFRILIGHSGSRLMNHIKIMESLKHLLDKPIKLVLVLSYGNKEYIREVKEYALSDFKQNNLEIIDDFMSLESYLQMLNKMDIVIFDQLGSAALGNLTPLLYFEKKFVLNKDGLMRRVFDIEGIDYLTTDKLSTITFDELIAPSKTRKKEREVVADEIADAYSPNTWKNLFKKLSDTKRSDMKDAKP